MTNRLSRSGRTWNGRWPTWSSRTSISWPRWSRPGSGGCSTGLACSAASWPRPDSTSRHFS